jgi:hypothetical protein
LQEQVLLKETLIYAMRKLIKRADFASGRWPAKVLSKANQQRVIFVK